MRMLSKFSQDNRGNVLVTFALVATALTGAVFGSMNIANGLRQKSHIQDALDAAALASVKQFASPTSDSTIVSTAKTTLASGKDLPVDIGNTSVAVDDSAQTVTLNYRGNVTGNVATALWNGIIGLNVTSKAQYGAMRLPVCILILDQAGKHTLRGSNGSEINLNNCMVQVNTTDWDAVEMADTAYLHSKNGQNCLVGDIHFGDVSPGKSPNCTFFADPFAGMTVPASPTCDYTNYTVKTAGGPALQPGVYCGGLTIQQSATFKPGVYIIKNGDLNITGSSTDVTANGVTFILTGSGSGLTINSGGTLNFSPAAPAVAGAFSGFAFYLDQSTVSHALASSHVTAPTMNVSGIVYLAGQQLVLSATKKTDSNLTISPGSIIVDYLLPQGGNLTVNGAIGSDAAAQAMQKPTTPVPTLIQ